MSADRQYALRYSSLCVRDVEGWLVKEGRSLRARRSRYVRLRGAVLSSHRSKNAPASWEVAVTNATVARGPNHEWHILLDLPSRHISFLATGKKQFEEWIYALRRASLFSSRVEDYYRVRHIVGEGMNGKVRLGNDLITDETVAIKTVPRLGRTNEDDFLAREVQIMLSMDHPNIVKTFDIFVRRKRIHFVMEYVPGGELFDLVAANTLFTEPRAASVMNDLLSAISYLHTHNIAHRDVKLENLLCMRKSWPLHVKLADFGFANHIRSEEDKMLSSFVGTPYYIAPEMLLSKGHGRPVDIWACGVVLYILLSGKFPFGGETEKEYYSRVLSREVYFPSAEWKSISAEAKNLVSGMLTKDPNKRLTAEQCLSHPWLKSVRKESAPAATPSKPDHQAVSLVTASDSSPDSARAARPPAMFRRNRSKLTKARQPQNNGRESPCAAQPAPPSPRHTNLQNMINNSTMRRKKRETEKKDVDMSSLSQRRDTEKRLTEGPAHGARRKMKPVSSHQDVHVGPPSDSNLLRANPLPARAPVEPPGTRGRPRPSSMRQSGTLPYTSRRQSLIRRLLSSGRVSLDHRDTRYPSFSGHDADPDDEASAVPRKTISLFGKLAPIRRSFHRARGSPDDDTLGVGVGINFVNSQTVPGSQRLPPKLAREQLRQQAAQESKPSRRGIFRFRRSSMSNRSARSLTATDSGPPSANLTAGVGLAPTSVTAPPSLGGASRSAQDDNGPHAAPGLGRQHASASRIMSDTTSGARAVSEQYMSAQEPRSAQWPDSRARSSRSRLSGRIDTQRMHHSSSEPPSRPFVADVNNTPLSQLQMSVVLGLDDAESHCSLQPSSASSFGNYAWGTQCAPPEQKRTSHLATEIRTVDSR